MIGKREKYAKERREMEEALQYYRRSGPPEAAKHAQKVYDRLVDIQIKNLMQDVEAGLTTLMDIRSKRWITRKLLEMVNKIVVEGIMAR
jgi:hypothetical protein